MPRAAGEGVDIVFNCAGIQPGLQDGIEALRHGGIYLNVAGWEKLVSIAAVRVLLRSTETFIDGCANRTPVIFLDWTGLDLRIDPVKSYGN